MTIEMKDLLKNRSVETNGQLLAWRSEHSKFSELDRSGDLHSTVSSLDALSDLSSSRSGYYDLLEVVDLVLSVAGYDEMQTGVLFAVEGGVEVYVDTAVISKCLLMYPDAGSAEIVNVALNLEASQELQEQMFEGFTKQQLSMHVDVVHN